jgi:hypothetical protein
MRGYSTCDNDHSLLLALVTHFYGNGVIRQLRIKTTDYGFRVEVPRQAVLRL